MKSKSFARTFSTAVAKTDAHAPDKLFPLAVATALNDSADTSAPEVPTTMAEREATSSCFCASESPSRLDTTIFYISIIILIPYTNKICIKKKQKDEFVQIKMDMYYCKQVLLQPDIVIVNN